MGVAPLNNGGCLGSKLARGEAGNPRVHCFTLRTSAMRDGAHVGRQHAHCRTGAGRAIQRLVHGAPEACLDLSQLGLRHQELLQTCLQLGTSRLTRGVPQVPPSLLIPAQTSDSETAPQGLPNLYSSLYTHPSGCRKVLQPLPKIRALSVC